MQASQEFSDIQSTLSNSIFKGHKFFYLIRESIELWSVEIERVDCITKYTML